MEICFKVNETGAIVTKVIYGEEIDEGFGYCAFTPSPFTSED